MNIYNKKKLGEFIIINIIKICFVVQKYCFNLNIADNLNSRCKDDGEYCS